MKRDLTLTRKILERIEEAGPDDEVNISMNDHPEAVVMYHLKLMKEAGFITAIDASYAGGEAYLPQSLTWQGHEFLDTIRNDTALSKVKNKAGGDLSNIPFEVLKNVVGETIKYGLQSI
jgi:hypothetical protein